MNGIIVYSYKASISRQTSLYAREKFAKHAKTVLKKQSVISAIKRRLYERKKSYDDEDDEPPKETFRFGGEIIKDGKVYRSKIYSKVQEDVKMKKFLSKFVPCDMGPFLESVDTLLENMTTSQEVVDRMRRCPVPRAPDTPFPMLYILNGQEITIEEYLIAENEEIFDTCIKVAGRRTDTICPSSGEESSSDDEFFDIDDEMEEPPETARTEETESSTNFDDDLNDEKIHVCKDEEDRLYRLKLLHREKPDLVYPFIITTDSPKRKCVHFMKFVKELNIFLKPQISLIKPLKRSILD